MSLPKSSKQIKTGATLKSPKKETEKCSINSPNPLLNHMVIERILYFAQPTFTDLKIFRQVCKMWYAETLKTWRNSVVVNLIPEPMLFVRDNLQEIGVSPTEYFSHLQNTSPHQENILMLAQKPYQKYQLKEIQINYEVCNRPGPSKQFWDLIGPNITFMSLKNLQFSGNQVELISFLGSKTPNLETLVLNKISLTELRDLDLGYGNTFYFEGMDSTALRMFNRNTERSGRRPVVQLRNLKKIILGNKFKFDLDFYRHFPNLEDLELHGKAINKIFDFTVFQQSRNFVNPTIKNLSFLVPSIPTNPLQFWNDLKKIRFSSLTTLSLKTVPLQEMILFGGDGYLEQTNSSEHFLKPLIRATGETLETLKIFRAPFFSPFKKFPFNTQMNCLTEFHMWGNLTPDFKFLKFMPNLKQLYISLKCEDRSDEIREELLKSGNSPQGLLDKIFLNGHDMIQISQDDVEMENLLLTHMQSFRIDFLFPIPSLIILASWMPNLTKLETILNGETLAAVCEKWKELEQLSCLYDSQICDQDLKNLVDLQKLERFQLQSTCGTSEITNSATNFLVNAASLKDVELCVSPHMTKSAESTLRNNIPFVKLIRNYESNGEHKDWSCCQRQKYFDEIIDVHACEQPFIP